jgi:hypothetical protein
MASVPTAADDIDVPNANCRFIAHLASVFASAQTESSLRKPSLIAIS